MLLVALEARDRADAAAAVIATEGMVLSKPGGVPRAHPLLRVEKDSRALFARCWSDLHLGWGPLDG